MIEPTCERLFKVNQKNPIKYIRCDDGGENKGLKNRLHGTNWKMPIKFEFTGRDTPQRNYLAEVSFATLAARGRAIMSAANIPVDHRKLFWREAFQTSTYLDGLILVEVDGVIKTRFEYFEGELPKFSKYLRTWGEAGVVKLKSPHLPKIYNRGKTCMFIGYSLNHAGDTYRMWDPDSKRVHLSRDIVWLNKMFFKKLTGWITTDTEVTKNLNTKHIDEVEDEVEIVFEDDSQEDIEEDSHEEIKVDDNIIDFNEGLKHTTRSGRNVRLPARFREEMENLLYEENSDYAREKTNDEMILIGAGIGEGILHTGELHVMKFKDAMESPDRDKWKLAIKEEHERMVKNNVWTPVKLTNLPFDSKLLTTTWAMKKKANGQF